MTSCEKEEYFNTVGVLARGNTSPLPTVEVGVLVETQEQPMDTKVNPQPATAMTQDPPPIATETVE